MVVDISVFICNIIYCSRWTFDKVIFYLLIFNYVIFSGICSELNENHDSFIDSSNEGTFQWAVINITYKNPTTEQHVHDIASGKFGFFSLIAARTGVVMPVRNKDNQTHGCDEYNINLPSEAWIALVERGKCLFTDKILLATGKYNATAVIIYNNRTDGGINIMQHSVNDQVSISVSYATGVMLSRLSQKGVHVIISITPGEMQTITLPAHNSISKTSVLLVSISFIVLLFISLAWLVYYYVQRFRYTHAKQRLMRRLANTTKKAILKIPQKTIKDGDKELDTESDQCAVCIEMYKLCDVVRILPCKHVFHKSCVDPWLLERRSCPMCKLDILCAYGMQVTGSADCVQTSAEGSRLVTPLQAEYFLGTSMGRPIESREVRVLLLYDSSIHADHHPSVEHMASDASRSSRNLSHHNGSLHFLEA